MMLGYGEWAIIGVITMLLFGSKRLPELAKGVGESIGIFRKSVDLER